jgi:hypothetical protein
LYTAFRRYEPQTHSELPSGDMNLRPR